MPSVASYQQRHEFDNEAWHLVGGYRRGMGRSWLGWLYNPVEADIFEASSSLPPLKARMRAQLVDWGVPYGQVRYRQDGRVTFVYVPAKYTEDWEK